MMHRLLTGLLATEPLLHRARPQIIPRRHGADAHAVFDSYALQTNDLGRHRALRAGVLGGLRKVCWVGDRLGAAVAFRRLEARRKTCPRIGCIACGSDQPETRLMKDRYPSLNCSSKQRSRTPTRSEPQAFVPVK